MPKLNEGWNSVPIGIHMGHFAFMCKPNQEIHIRFDINETVCYVSYFRFPRFGIAAT